MKDKLVLLVGPSGSGKTTISKELEKEGYNIIHSYTTRPPREPNEWGHIFIEKPNFESEEDYLKYKDDINKIAFFDGYGEIYFATRDQYQGKGTSIYAIDPSGAEDVRKRVKDAEVITIFLICDADVRINRLIKRSIGVKGQSIFTLGDRVYQRLVADEKIFSKCKCDYVVDANRELPEVLADIKEIIGEVNQ